MLIDIHIIDTMIIIIDINITPESGCPDGHDDHGGDLRRRRRHGRGAPAEIQYNITGCNYYVICHDLA